MNITNNYSNGECVIIQNKTRKKLNHQKLQKKFCKLFKRLEKQKKENYVYTGKFVE